MNILKRIKFRIYCDRFKVKKNEKTVQMWTIAMQTQLLQPQCAMYNPSKQFNIVLN